MLKTTMESPFILKNHEKMTEASASVCLILATAMISAAVYMKLGRNAWCLVLGRNDIFCLIVGNSCIPYYSVFKLKLKFLDPI